MVQRYTTLPPYEQRTDENKNAPVTKWSGPGAPPEIGERVKVTMNALGYGKVKAYFIEHGWLGVAVELENPPEWYVRQNGTQHRIAWVFGAEIKTTGKEQT